MSAGDYYPRDKLPERFRTLTSYMKVVKSIEDYDDFRYQFNSIIGECMRSFRTYQLCSALDELVQRTCWKFQSENKLFLMSVVNAHVANFYRDRLCQLASINDFGRKTEDFPYLDNWYTESEIDSGVICKFNSDISEDDDDDDDESNKPELDSDLTSKIM